MKGEKKPAAPGSTAGQQQQHQTTTPDAGAIVAGQDDGGKLKLSPRQAQATATPDAPTADVSTTLHPPVVTTMQAGSTALATAQVGDAPAQTTTPPRRTRRTAAPRAAAMRDTGVGQDDGARFLRVKEGIEAGRIKPSLRGIYAAEGASQEVARRYLAELEQAGVIEKQGRGYRLATRTGKAAA